MNQLDLEIKTTMIEGHPKTHFSKVVKKFLRYGQQQNNLFLRIRISQKGVHIFQAS